MKRLVFQSLGALAGFALVALLSVLALSPPAAAQRGFFDSIFGPYQGPRTYEPRPSVDYSRAPSPHKPDTPPATTVLVLGDSMADWLSYGLEEALADTPELGVVRKARSSSGLIRYENKADAPDWPQVARDAITTEKPKFVVVMLGLHDRQAIREVAPQEEQKSDKAEKTKEHPTAVPSRPRPAPLHEYGSEQWIELYTKKIDAMIAAAKSGGVPVLWVGLPAVRGTKSTGDMLFLNDLYRARAEKAGITYVDVWDGFVDEAGRFAVQGPDFEGQTRRLRTADGVHFTKAGARKLAHYVEREIRRTLQHGPIAVALPSSEPLPQLKAPAARPVGPAERPIAGPVLPLTSAVSAPGEDLLGAPNTADKPGHVTATRVLVKGEAMAVPAGRSDDFVWPRRTVAPFNTDPAVATTTLPIPVMQPPAAKTVLAPNVDTPVVAPVHHSAAAPRPREPRQQPNPFFFLPFFR